MKKNNIMNLIISAFASIIIFFGLNYVLLMPINIKYLQTVITYLIVFSLTYSVVSGMRNKKTDRYEEMDYNKYFKGGVKPNISPAVVISVVIVLAYSAVSFVTSSPILNAKEYSELIGEVSEPKDFVTEFSIVDENELPVVDSALARQLGDKEFGKYGSLGSEFHVGGFSDISADGELYAVAPLEYNGIFKWINNLEGTPGYVMIDKVTEEVTINTDYSLKYTNTAYLNNNIKRHIYYNGGMGYRLTNFSLELDDNLKPYWVVSALEPTIGLTGGEDVAGIFVVDPTNGDTEFYEVGNVPSWVDTVYPADLIVQQLNDWGKYQDGWFNSMFGQKNVIQTTEGTRRVYNENDVFHYTGLTSISADEATVGFMFVNTTTKEATRYSMSGATEVAAMSSAMGEVQNFGYVATFPIPVNLNNEPTFFITLKDNKGLIKQYAFVNIEEFSIVGVGDTIGEAKNNYLKQIDFDVEDLTDKESVMGTVKRINSSVVANDTYFYIMLEDSNEVYEVPLRISNLLVLTEPGDEVEIIVSNGNYVDFENNTINN